METTKIIEINGVKVEVDLREANVIEKFRIGDRVRILVKNWNDNYTAYNGVIVAFDAFKILPTMTIAYVKNDGEICFGYLHKNSTDIEIAPANDNDILMDKADIVARIDSNIEKKQLELDELKQKKKFFLEKFGRWYGLKE